jgi:PAS domain S-box-containing protein
MNNPEPIPRILIVDDAENVRLFFAHFLSQEGYLVETAPDYESALQVMDSKKIDLIYADIILGGPSGLEILKKNKGRSWYCPLILITGEPRLETAIEAVRQGAFDYLSKPINKNTLWKATKQALEYKNLVDEKYFLQLETDKYRRNLESIFESVKDAIVTVDSQKRVIEANEAIYRLCEVTPAELFGQSFPETLKKCSQACKYAIEDVLHRKKRVDEYRVECRHEGRPDKVVILNCSPWNDPLGNFVGAVLVIRDITRLANLEDKLMSRMQYDDLIGQSRKMQKVYETLDFLKKVDSNVLITGESGTGKGVAAKILHDSGLRSDKPFVTVNCSTLSQNLLESELFGHVKGAFTGAVQDKIGRFQMADQGTIFLDEIGDIPPNMQLKLLSFLDSYEFQRVGESQTTKVDVRIIAATNQDLLSKVESGEFRQDLYFRLKVVEMQMPPLRERREDIPLLTEYFRNYFNFKFKRQIEAMSAQVVHHFKQYPWPGNVRELRHAIEHSFVVCKGSTIRSECLPAEIVNNYNGPLFGSNNGLKKKNNKDSEYAQLLKALKECGWNKAKAARFLGVSRQTIYRKIKNFGIFL